MLERLLIVGFGSIGMRHARIAKLTLPNLRIIVLRHGRFSDEKLPNVDCCVGSMSEALQHNPQAAVISSPSSMHLAAAIPLALAGVHLLIEKPIADRIEGVAELIGICRSRGLVLMTGYNLRYLPSLFRFRELLQAKRIGDVLSVRAEVGQFLPSWRPKADYRKSVSAKAELGGGVLLELSHEIDYLRWLFGEITWVSAIQVKQSSLEIDVEDTAHLNLGFEDKRGSPALIANLNMDFIRHDTSRLCTVIGDEGTLRWNALTGVIEIFEPGGVWQVVYAHQHQSDESYLAQWENFLNCIFGIELPLVTGDDGLAVVEIVEAARRSSMKRSVVMVDNLTSN
jgi:predicted dehydrogenase